MRFVDDFRNEELVTTLALAIKHAMTKPWRIMEVCGGQTHTIVKHGLDQLLPSGLELVHGPGCPVCVTPTEKIDAAIKAACVHGVILCTFGDMLRVPGTSRDLLTAKAYGADVRTIYSPLEALSIARDNPGREVVFFAVGFETTAPANAMAVYRAKSEGLRNFSIISALVLVPPILRTLLDTAGVDRVDAVADNGIAGVLAAGHVCAVTGLKEYHRLAQSLRLPIVVTGFEPVDIMQGILMCVQQLETRQYRVENQYSRVVSAHGNTIAQRIVAEVFAATEAGWRDLARVSASGLSLRDGYLDYDAELKFRLSSDSLWSGHQRGLCRAGAVLTGLIKPPQCSAFATECTPMRPLGAPMVSSEGACAAYFHYRGGQVDGGSQFSDLS
jgi:hydrogenase expression/formation protein HypD